MEIGPGNQGDAESRRRRPGIRDIRSANTCPSSFLSELPRFDNSQNVKVRVPKNTSTFSEFRKRENDGSTLFRSALLVPSPEIRSSVFFASGGAMRSRSHRIPSVFACQKPIQSCGGRALANSSKSSCLLSLTDIRRWSLRRRRRLLSKLSQSSSSALKLSHKLLSTSLLWRNIVIEVHDRMPV